MAPPFHDGLGTLTLDELQTFLNAELEEGLTWEAKGGDSPHSTSVRRAVSGFANAIGGSLILGAEDDGGSWRLPGMTFPGGEASTWLSNVIGELSPVPRYDVRVFPLEDSRIVAIVAVEPIDVPPCMSGSSVFERVSGQTVPVTDPAVLRSLFASGDESRERATELARDAAKLIYASPHPTSPAHGLVPAEESTPQTRVAFGLALAPVGWSAASSRVVFTEPFADALLERLTATNPRELPMMGPTTLDMSRAWVHGTVPLVHGAWFVRVYARGAAAVAFGSDRIDEHVPPHEVMVNLERAWRLAADVLSDAGAAGEARLALHLQTTRYPPGGQWAVSPKPQIGLVRSTVVGAPRPAEIDSIRRELEREAGGIAFEPDA